MPNSKVLLDFVQTFNKSHDLAEIIDAGNDKEAADTKIKATFNLYHRNVHCKHILFSGSGDNSYVGFLRRYVPVEGISQSITLMESLPFATYLEPLSRNLQVAKFPKIFRDTKIQFNTARSSTQENTKPLATKHKTPPSRWGTPVKDALSAVRIKTENISPPPVTAPETTSGHFIYQNNKGKRVNKPTNKDIFDKDVVNKLKWRKMCNKYWLLGKCDQGESCTHDHKGPLSPKELENLRFVARMRPCGAIRTQK